jgi:hypothetical protein
MSCCGCGTSSTLFSHRGRLVAAQYNIIFKPISGSYVNLETCFCFQEGFLVLEKCSVSPRIFLRCCGDQNPFPVVSYHLGKQNPFPVIYYHLRNQNPFLRILTHSSCRVMIRNQFHLGNRNPFPIVSNHSGNRDPFPPYRIPHYLSGNDQ